MAFTAGSGLPLVTNSEWYHHLNYLILIPFCMQQSEQNVLASSLKAIKSYQTTPPIVVPEFL